MSRSVPRIGRILDAVSALIFLSGALLYGWTWLELRGPQASPAQPGGEGFSFAAVERVEDLHRMGDQGLILMGLGAVLAVVAAVAARRIASREDPSSAKETTSP